MQDGTHAAPRRGRWIRRLVITFATIFVLWSAVAAWLLATAWRRVERYEPARQSAAAASILTADGYDAVIDEHARPFVFEVEAANGAVLVFGDTHPVRELLKSLGLSWNRQLGGWIGTWSQRWGIIARLRDSPEVELTVTFDESAIQPPKQERHSNNFCDGPVNMAHINNIARRWGGSTAQQILEKMSREGQM